MPVDRGETRAAVVPVTASTPVTPRGGQPAAYASISAGRAAGRRSGRDDRHGAGLLRGELLADDVWTCGWLLVGQHTIVGKAEVDAEERLPSNRSRHHGRRTGGPAHDERGDAVPETLVDLLVARRKSGSESTR